MGIRQPKACNKIYETNYVIISDHLEEVSIKDNA